MRYRRTEQSPFPSPVKRRAGNSDLDSVEVGGSRPKGAGSKDTSGCASFTGEARLE